jgi:hypothetical protein
MAARSYHCKICNEPFPNPAAVGKHKRKDHADGGTKPKRKKYTRRAQPARAIAEVAVAPVPALADPEAALLATCMNAFAVAGTDRDADFRVLEYLAQRFGPIAYKDAEAA